MLEDAEEIRAITDRKLIPPGPHSLPHRERLLYNAQRGRPSNRSNHGKQCSPITNDGKKSPGHNTRNSYMNKKTKTSNLLAQKVLDSIRGQPNTLPLIEAQEGRRNNAARCMNQLFCNRLSSAGETPVKLKHTTYQWGEGVIAVRNARVTDHHWSTLQTRVAEQLRKEGISKPVVYALTYWAISEGFLHVWALPEHIAFQIFAEIPFGKDGTYKTVEVFPDTHSVKNAPNAPDLSPYYIRTKLRREELGKLVEAIKIDRAAKRIDQSLDGEVLDGEETGEEFEPETAPGFNSATVTFIKELPRYVQDAEWHEKHKQRYQNVLREPARRLAEALRDKFIERLSPEVAGGKRQLSILKKNDYGKGGYHDHYWFAFYDPAAGSKTKSVQLYFRMIGSKDVWCYGFAMGNYCQEYIQRLRVALRANAKSAAEYVLHAPADTSVRLWADDVETRMTPVEFAHLLVSDSDEWFGENGKLSDINVVREYPLATLPSHESGLVDEIGEYFVWAWPFFEASMSGIWPKIAPMDQRNAAGGSAEEDVDEDAPRSLAELSELTSVSQNILEELEQSLLAKQQAVLVGPPGTSKTYIARQFARYFVRQTPGRTQGKWHVLYMHANWSYEDFFEGIKPSTSKEGLLVFQQQKGFFLEWVEQLKAFDTSARHVLVLDEINRCDTAAVLGELLQLLEYRGTTIRLLSGRRFVFPRNLFIIGTMNSADRSIGRMDLALRRRFFWLNLHSQPDALQRWLDRLGNNPIGFTSSSLAHCNELLANRGIPSEQHIGHALFMGQVSDGDDETGMAGDIPLTESHLRRIVQFSILPYVRELFLSQFGHVDEALLSAIRGSLLSCLERHKAPPTDE